MNDRAVCDLLALGLTDAHGVQPKPRFDNGLMSRKQVCARLGLSDRSLYNAVAAGLLIPIRNPVTRSALKPHRFRPQDVYNYQRKMGAV